MSDNESSDEDFILDDLKKEKKSAKKKKKKPKAVKPDPVLSSSKKRKHSDIAISGSAKKKVKIKREDNGVTKPKAKVKMEDDGNKKQPRTLKKLEKIERLQYGMQSFLWWEAHDPPPGCQWDTMEHAGVSFPEPYVTHGVKMLYDGKPVDLTPVQEEALSTHTRLFMSYRNTMTALSHTHSPCPCFHTILFQCDILCSSRSRRDASRKPKDSSDFHQKFLS